MKRLTTLILFFQVIALSAQVPETNLVFRLDYDANFSINVGETAIYDIQGGYLSEDRYDIQDNSCVFEADKQLVKFDEFPCLEQEITVSLWLKIESFQGDRYPIIQLSNSDEFTYGETIKFGFEVQNDKTAVGYYNQIGGRVIYDQDSVTYDNEWHHLLGTISDLNLIKLYIDNKFIGSQEFNNGTFESMDQIIIGGGYDGLFGHLSIDDIRIYNRSLERCEIESLFYEKDMTVDCEMAEEKLCGTTTSKVVANNEIVNIYPNPCKFGRIKINNYQDSKYRLFNIFGEEVKNGTIENNEISVHELSTGVYVIEVDNISQKVVLE